MLQPDGTQDRRAQCAAYTLTRSCNAANISFKESDRTNLLSANFPRLEAVQLHFHDCIALIIHALAVWLVLLREIRVASIVKRIHHHFVRGRKEAVIFHTRAQPIYVTLSPAALVLFKWLWTCFHEAMTEPGA